MNGPQTPEQKWLAIRNRERGLCGCGKPRRSGRASCQDCIDSGHARARARRKEPGHCSRCGVPLDRPGRCDKCRVTEAKMKNRLRAKRKKLGLCVRCGGTPVPGKTLCEVHGQQMRDIYWKRKGKK